MPDNHASKQRCDKCKSVLIKGVVVLNTGIAEIECGKCQQVNVLAVVPQRAILPVIVEKEMEIMTERFEQEIDAMKHRFGGLHPADERNLRSAFDAKKDVFRFRRCRATGT